MLIVDAMFKEKLHLLPPTSSLLPLLSSLPNSNLLPPSLPPAAGLRTPMAVSGPYPGAFGMLPHGAGMNGDLAGAAAYAAGLHNMSPQMSAAAAAAAVAAYGRSPMVRPSPLCFP